MLIRIYREHFSWHAFDIALVFQTIIGFIRGGNMGAWEIMTYSGGLLAASSGLLNAK